MAHEIVHRYNCDNCGKEQIIPNHDDHLSTLFRKGWSIEKELQFCSKKCQIKYGKPKKGKHHDTLFIILLLLFCALPTLFEILGSWIDNTL